MSTTGSVYQKSKYGANKSAPQGRSTPGWYIDRPTLWCWFIGSVFALLIDRPCGADLMSPGCYFNWPALWCLCSILVDSHPLWYDFGRPALWCWFKGSGVLFWYTGPVVLICWLRDVVLVDNLAHRYNFYRLALWCWFFGSGVVYW